MYVLQLKHLLECVVQQFVSPDVAIYAEQPGYAQIVVLVPNLFVNELLAVFVDEGLGFWVATGVEDNVAIAVAVGSCVGTGVAACLAERMAGNQSMIKRYTMSRRAMVRSMSAVFFM